MLPISVCIITKNEEKHLRNCLERLKKYDWEIVVADTGSKDNTRSIAVELADKVVDFTWCNDFSAAKNFVVSQASNDFVLVLDSDEYLASVDPDQLVHHIANTPETVGKITLLHHYETNQQDTTYTEYNQRFFNKNYFHFIGSIHEQLKRIDNTPFQSQIIPVRIDHYGYILSAEEKQAKIERNLTLLFEDLKKNPDSPYLLFQIGQCYNMLDDAPLALQYYGKALEYDINPNDDAAIMLIVAYGYSLLHTGHIEDALQLSNIYDEFSTSSDFFCLMGNVYMQNKLPIKSMTEFLKAVTCDKHFVSGSNFEIPLYNIGLLYEMMGKRTEAISYYQKCGDFTMAKNRLAEINSQKGN